MNTLYNSALRQGSAIRKDLDVLAEGTESSPALLGQISASLTSFSRTIDDYNKLAKQELVPEKQQKAFERVKTFRSELVDYRERFERLKHEADERQTTTQRAELLGRRPHHASTPENPYANAIASSSPFAPRDPNNLGPNPYSSAGIGIGSSNPFGAAPHDAARTSHALREQSFMGQTHAALDEFLERGSDVLSNLGAQREVLKGTQRRLYDVGNTLGVSGETIRTISRRARQDKWIFWGGVVIFFVFCYLLLKWLR